MPRGVNKAIILGYLGGDPDIRSTPSGIQIATFNVATSERWRDKSTGETKERTEWHRCEVWGKQAEAAAQYLRKGSQVYCEGSLRTEKWTDKNNIDRYITKIRLTHFQMLGPPPGEPPVRPAKAVSHAPADEPIPGDFDDDIPFD